MQEQVQCWKNLEIRWGDQDAMGHVNNAKYPTYFEEARIAFFTEIGISLDKPNYPQQGPILAAANTQFKQQLRWPAAVRIGIRVLKIGNSSFHIRQVLYRKDSDELICQSDAVIVWFHYGQQRSISIPDPVRERLKKL